MTGDEKPNKKPNKLAQIWNSLDKSVQLIIVGGIVILVLYYFMSPLQQCKREKPHGYCYRITSW